MRRTMLIAFVVAAISTMAVPAIAGTNDDVSNGELPAGCVKLEGEALGVEYVSVEVDGVTVELHNWVEKPGEDGEYIGFDFDTYGGTFSDLSIKSGKKIDSASIAEYSYFGSWLSPEDAGAKAISNIVFCGAEVDDFPPNWPPVN